MKKAQNIFEFFKSTLVINFAVCFIAMLFGEVESVFFIFASFGFIVSLVYKEIYTKSDYLFYSNNGISKINLCLYSYLITVVFSFLGLLFFYLIRMVF
jgi:hypothetical protein